MLNNGSDMLEEIIQVGKGFGNLKGVGFNYQSLNRQGETSVTKFVPLERKFEFVMRTKCHNILSNIKKSKLEPSSFLGNVIIMVDMVI